MCLYKKIKLIVCSKGNTIHLQLHCLILTQLNRLIVQYSFIPNWIHRFLSLVITFRLKDYTTCKIGRSQLITNNNLLTDKRNPWCSVYIKHNLYLLYVAIHIICYKYVLYRKLELFVSYIIYITIWMKQIHYTNVLVVRILAYNVAQCMYRNYFFHKMFVLIC